MTRSGIIQVLSFFIYFIVQVLILKNAVLFHTAFCFLYIAYLLLLPVETNPLILMAIAFAFGFSIDVFYDSLGLHAFACVFIAYIRNYWLARITPQGGYDIGVLPGVSAHGVQWFLVYALPLVFLHHGILFFTEAGGFDYFWFTIKKILASLIFTMVVMLMLQFVIPERRRL